MVSKIDTDADGNLINGKVNFTTDTLVTHDLINTTTNDQRNVGGTLNGGQGKNGASINNASIQAGHTGQEYQSITKATVGEGAIVTSDITSGQDSLAGVNRDALNTETVIKDMQTGGLDLNATVDTRVFTDAGRAEIIGEQKELV